MDYWKDWADPVEVGFSPPAPQRRSTVALRFFVLVPHFLFAIPVLIAEFVVVVASWFVALVLARVPLPMYRFLASTVGYHVRVGAYALLLTDVYPPFTLKDVEYPVSVKLEPSRLNRAAVFFRLILIIPAAFLNSWLTSGLGVCLIFFWLIVLVSGRMPRPAFEAVAAVFRYQVRYLAYLILLTPEYPGGLFGEPVGSLIALPPLPSQQLPAAGEDAALASDEATDAQVEPDPLAPLEPVSTVPPLATRLVLSKGAKVMVSTFIVLGVVGSFFGERSPVGVHVHISTTSERNKQAVIAAANKNYQTLSTAVKTFQASTSSCVASRDLACVQRADAAFATAFMTFDKELDFIKFPNSAKAALKQVHTDTKSVADKLNQMATASAAGYQSFALDLQPLLNQFDQDYRKLGTAITGKG